MLKSTCPFKMSTALLLKWTRFHSGEGIMLIYCLFLHVTLGGVTLRHPPPALLKSSSVLVAWKRTCVLDCPKHVGVCINFVKGLRHDAFQKVTELQNFQPCTITSLCWIKMSARRRVVPNKVKLRTMRMMQFKKVWQRWYCHRRGQGSGSCSRFSDFGVVLNLNIFVRYVLCVMRCELCAMFFIVKLCVMCYVPAISVRSLCVMCYVPAPLTTWLIVMLYAA